MIHSTIIQSVNGDGRKFIIIIIIIRDILFNTLRRQYTVSTQ
jgi:hypothetical protein